MGSTKSKQRESPGQAYIDNPNAETIAAGKVTGRPASRQTNGRSIDPSEGSPTERSDYHFELGSPRAQIGDTEVRGVRTPSQPYTPAQTGGLFSNKRQARPNARTTDGAAIIVNIDTKTLTGSPRGQTKSQNKRLNIENDRLKTEKKELKRQVEYLEEQLKIEKARKPEGWRETPKPPAESERLSQPTTKDPKPKEFLQAGRFSDGTECTISGTKKDDQWIGLVTVTDADGKQYRYDKLDKLTYFERCIDPATGRASEIERCWMGKNLNKSIFQGEKGEQVYECTDEKNHGVVVVVLYNDDQPKTGYPLKNGYKVELHTHKDEIGVEKYDPDGSRSVKWYQLKK